MHRSTPTRALIEFEGVQTFSHERIVWFRAGSAMGQLNAALTSTMMSVAARV